MLLSSPLGSERLLTALIIAQATFNVVLLNRSQLAKMKKYIPHISLP